MSEQVVTRAITLWPEWAFAITHLSKRVENRTWDPPAGVVGTRIAIHAGAHVGGRKATRATIEGGEAMQETAEAAGWEIGWGTQDSLCVDFRRQGTKGQRTQKLTTGAVVATAIVHSVRDADTSVLAGAEHDWDVGPRCWVLRRVRWLIYPVPMKGAQGLWHLGSSAVEKVNEARSILMPDYLDGLPSLPDRKSPT